MKLNNTKYKRECGDTFVPAKNAIDYDKGKNIDHMLFLNFLKSIILHLSKHLYIPFQVFHHGRWNRNIVVDILVVIVVVYFCSIFLDFATKTDEHALAMLK